MSNASIMDTLPIFRQLPDNLIVLAPDYKILDATEAYLRVTRRQREEIIGRHFLLEAFPDPNYTFEENPVRQSFEKVLTTKSPDQMSLVSYRIAVPESEGGGFYDSFWEASHTPVFDGAGNLAYIVQKTSDVTEVEIARRAQAISEVKFNMMTDTVPQLIYTTDSTGKLNYVNRRWTQYTGISETEALGTGFSWFDLVHPDDLPALLPRARDSFSRGVEVQAEIRLRNQEGHYRWFMTKTTPVSLQAQGPIVMWVGSCSDIHTTKKMVQELVETNEQMSVLSDQVQEALKRAEAERQTLERLIMAAPAFFCILRGRDHRFELVNEKYQQLLPAKDLLGRTVEEVMPEVVEQGFIRILDQVFETGETFRAEEIPIKLDRNNTGELEEIFVSFVYQAIYDESSRISGILVCGYEVTENVKLREKIKGAQLT